jgi:hypothetical protein
VMDQACRPETKEGAGNAGRSTAPAASCVKWKTHELVTTGTPNIPTFPAQWF